MNILLSYVQVFRQAKPYALYVLFVLFVTFMLNQLDRYALAITNIETAQELKYGDRACLKLSNQTKAVESCANLTEAA